jgi:hypothetical protein
VLGQAVVAAALGQAVGCRLGDARARVHRTAGGPVGPSARLDRYDVRKVPISQGDAQQTGKVLPGHHA